MKLTKTENVKAFKFDSDDGYEIIAATSLEQAKQLADEYYDLNDLDDNFNITHMTERRLDNEIGYNVSRNFRKGGKMTALEALKKGYQRNQVPFIFWTTYLD